MPEFTFWSPLFHSVTFWAQCLGFLSYALGVYCFYQKNDRKLKMTMLAFNTNHAIHFLLLDAHTAAIGSLLSGIRTALSIKTSSRWVAYTCMIIGASWGIYSASSILELLPIVGFVIGTYAVFCLHGIKMRIAFLMGACCWLANNILVGSIGGALLELTLISVNCLTIYRIRTGTANLT